MEHNNESYIKNNDKYYVQLKNITLDNFIFDVNSLPENVKRIYIIDNNEEYNFDNTDQSNNYIENFDINVINKMIECIKKVV